MFRPIALSLVILSMTAPAALARTPMMRKEFPRAAIGSGKLTAVNGTTLTIEKEGTTYSVATGSFDMCTTQIVHRFGGKSSLSELSVGDTVHIAGRYTDDSKSTINACVVRDLSLQKRRGTFMGEVKSLGGSSFVLTSVNRGDQSVSLETSTKIVDRSGKAISASDILVGHKVRVRGLWNNRSKTIKATEQVKDFSHGQAR